MTQKNSFASIINQTFAPYKIIVETQIKENIQSLGPKSLLRDACEYALLNGGKRFRPAIVHIIAEALGNADVKHAALAVEYFHTASLIADDLPCMDNDDERRQQPSLHKAFNETTALLASYALIASGYEALSKNAEVIEMANLPFSQRSGEICILALKNATMNTGLSGATGGQFLDVFPPELTKESLKEILYKKTVTLFEISFVLGWLYGGGEVKHLNAVKRASSHFGMAFQMADDIEDAAQDAAKGKKANIAVLCGEKEARAMLKQEIQQLKSVLNEIKIQIPAFHPILESLALF